MFDNILECMDLDLWRKPERDNVCRTGSADQEAAGAIAG